MKTFVVAQTYKIYCLIDYHVLFDIYSILLYSINRIIIFIFYRAVGGHVDHSLSNLTMTIKYDKMLLLTK